MSAFTIAASKIEGSKAIAPFSFTFKNEKRILGQLTVHYSDRYNARVVVNFTDEQGLPIGSYGVAQTHMRSSFHFEVTLDANGKITQSNFLNDGDAANVWFERLCETAGNFYGIPAAHVSAFIVGSMFALNSPRSETFRNFVENACKTILLNEEYFTEMRHCLGRVMTLVQKSSLRDGEKEQVEKYMADFFGRNGYTLTRNPTV